MPLVLIRGLMMFPMDGLWIFLLSWKIQVICDARAMIGSGVDSGLVMISADGFEFLFYDHECL
jgi:hypothetical protein